MKRNYTDLPLQASPSDYYKVYVLHHEYRLRKGMWQLWWRVGYFYNVVVYRYDWDHINNKLDLTTKQRVRRFYAKQLPLGKESEQA